MPVPILEERDRQGISSLIGDFDHKPGLEILNTHGDGKRYSVRLYGVKPQSHWIGFEPRLKNGGIPRGTIFILRTSLRDQLRVLSTGSGRFGNTTSQIIFGLKKDEKIKSVEFIMPSGERGRVEKVSEDSKIHQLILNVP